MKFKYQVTSLITQTQMQRKCNLFYAFQKRNSWGCHLLNNWVNTNGHSDDIVWNMLGPFYVFPCIYLSGWSDLYSNEIWHVWTSHDRQVLRTGLLIETWPSNRGVGGGCISFPLLVPVGAKTSNDASVDGGLSLLSICKEINAHFIWWNYSSQISSTESVAPSCIYLLYEVTRKNEY